MLQQCRLEALGRRCDVAIGDFDSLGYVPQARIVSRHPVKKDKSDLELALDRVASYGFDEVVIYGALGGRLDHTLSNLQLAAKFAERGIEVTFIGLDEAGQARMKEINSELATLALTFGNNLLAQSNAFKDSVGFSVASYYDKMASEADRAQREKIFRLYSNRGNNGDEFDNKATVLRIMELRIDDGL